MLSFDTYITLMIGDLFALIITVVFEILNTKDNKPGRKKRRKLLGVACAAVIIGIGLTVFYHMSKENQSKSAYATLISKGEFEYSNSNWIKAADWFSQANSVAYDLYSEAYSLQRQATCYYLNALTTNDKDYYVKALRLYKSIIDNPKLQKYQSYQIAMIDLCSIYCFLGYEWTNDDWSFVVEYLEKTFDFENIDNVDKEYLTILTSAGYSICLYYDIVLQSSSQLLLYSDKYQNKAIYYLKATAEAQALYNEYTGISVYNEVYYHTLYHMTTTILTNAFFNVNEGSSLVDMLSKFEDARIICQNAVSTLDIGNGNPLQLINYIQLKRNIGKSYLYSAYFTDYDSNMEKAYQELILPFYWKDDSVTEELLITASYAIMTGLCTKTDIETILSTCEHRIQNLRNNMDVADLINAEIVSLNICYAILTKYESNQTDVKMFGHEIWLDLNTSFYELLDDYEKELLENYHDTFCN